MFKNYLKTAVRNLTKNKAHSFINIAGLSVGMAVAILIGLWIWDELSFDKQNPNYSHIAQVMQNNNLNGQTGTWPTMPLPLAEELRRTYGSDFKYVVMASWNEGHVLSAGDKKFTKAGTFFEPKGPELLNTAMLKGSKDALNEPTAILISASTAKAFFGGADPINKIVTIDGTYEMKVAGVYSDFANNSSFAGITYMMPWQQKIVMNPWMKQMGNPWGNNSFVVYVQIAENADMAKVSAKIKDAKLRNVPKEEQRYNPALFLHPMSKWHLYSEFKNGVNTGGAVQFVWLFGIIGIFVLLLACINFMNLSTARSEKRAKEVGIRKAVGSFRSQLIKQFYSESIVVAVISFIVALLIVQLALPFFNYVAGKKMSILWANPFFWLVGVGFSIITGLIAGSYPALYLSSFNPVKVLKGTFKAGRLAAVPRKVLVVLQFSVSVILIIGTIVVFNQIQYAKNRPIGYNTSGLVTIQLLAKGFHEHFDIIKTELKSEGAIVEMAESSGPVTNTWQTNGGFDWKGKDPNLAVDFPNSSVAYDFGKTVGWQFVQGRDFSREHATDSSAFIINEAAVKYMGLKNPVGEIIKWDGQPMTVIGVIKDVITENPYTAVRPTLYYMNADNVNFDVFKINPGSSTRDALAKIEAAFKKYSPLQPFDYKFVSEEYEQKFGTEERIGKLASVFATLAIFISCLGLFGMATFMAEQRIKEIGVRKVLGASVANLWGLLSRDFVGLVVISLFISMPTAYYFMQKWLLNYEYRSGLPWWIFAGAGAGALIITILTVSYQSIKAALANPVKSLKTE